MTIDFSGRSARLRDVGAALLWIVALGAPVIAEAPAAPAGVIEAALQTRRDGARLTVTFPQAEAPHRRIAAFDKPPRIVLDIEGAQWRLRRDARGRTAGLRFGLVSPGWSRLIVDLDAPALPRRVETASEAGRTVLTLDLAETDADTFAAFAAMAPARAPDGASPTRNPGARFVVAIDPGHGGVDPGAVRDGLREKDLTLDFARDLARALEAQNFATALTRSADVFVSLPERVARARRAGAGAFLSIHADALAPGSGAASGASVYTLSAQASDAEAALLASRENQVDRLAGGPLVDTGQDLARTLIELVQRDTMAASQALGATLIAELGARTKLLSGRPLRSAGFRVLKAPDIPSALIELGFLSSAEDRARLRDPAWRAVAAEGIAAAVRRWADERVLRDAAAPQP